MRAFKNKWFQRWARREGISDVALYDAALEILKGNADADLGGYLFKIRLARSGTGKRSGYRIVVGYKKYNSTRIVFLYAFAKNERSNITKNEHDVLKMVAERFVTATDAMVTDLINNGEIWEVHQQ